MGDYVHIRRGRLDQFPEAFRHADPRGSISGDEKDFYYCVKPSLVDRQQDQKAASAYL